VEKDWPPVMKKNKGHVGLREEKNERKTGQSYMNLWWEMKIKGKRGFDKT